MKRATVEQVRKIQLELLTKLDLFFKENGIRYYAFAGTLLGAVRHKGFIPWDNDIDVAVSREDYKKMQILLNNEDSNDFFRFLCYENDHRFLWQFGKIVAKGTYIKTAGGYNRLGIFIDIFPLDSQGDDFDIAMDNLREVRKCVRLRAMSYDKKHKGIFSYPRCTDEEREELQRIFENKCQDDEEYWVKRHITLAQKFSDNKNSIYFGCNSNEKYTVVCERRYFDEIVYLDFETISLPAPIGYKEILSKYYGDYMKLPDKSHQVGLLESNIYITEE